MKKIIVPVDFSLHSEYALKAAALLAKKHHAELIALHMLELDRKSTRLNSSHVKISYAVFCLKKKKNIMYSAIIHTLFSLRVPRQQKSTLFPYTTLFRSIITTLFTNKTFKP